MLEDGFEGHFIIDAPYFSPSHQPGSKKPLIGDSAL